MPFEIIETRVSRVRRESIRAVEETRVYIVRAQDPGTLISPETALSQRFPNPRGSGFSAFSLIIGDPHPESVAAANHDFRRAFDTMFLAEVDAEWVPRSTTAIQVTATWRTMPNPNDCRWSMNVALSSEQTFLDINGKPLLINGVLAPVQRLTPRVQFQADSQPVKVQGHVPDVFSLVVADFVGKINEKKFKGFEPETLMLVDARMKTVNDDHVEFGFTFQWKTDGWQTVQVELDKETGLPTTDEDGNPVTFPRELYETADFSRLPCT